MDNLKDLEQIIINAIDKQKTELLALIDNFRNKKLKTQQQEVKRWEPKNGEDYCYIDADGDWFLRKYNELSLHDHHRLAIGNCYPPTNEGKELAIWEQVTRRRYEKALRDAADWVEGDYYCAYWCGAKQKIAALKPSVAIYLPLPLFATEQSCLEAHTRILGDDARRYFTGEK